MLLGKHVTRIMSTPSVLAGVNSRSLARTGRAVIGDGGEPSCIIATSRPIPLAVVSGSGAERPATHTLASLDGTGPRFRNGTATQ